MLDTKYLIRMLPPPDEDVVPIEFAPGVFRLGGVVSIGGRLSWYPSTWTGLAPVNCYFIRRGDSALMIDAGIALHEQLVIRQVKILMEGADHSAIALTRIVEFDSQGNAAALLERFHFALVLTNLPAFFITTPRSALQVPFKPSKTKGRVETLDVSGVPAPMSLRAEQPIAPQALPRLGQHIHALAAPLRLLATTWLYDDESGTLFTSDSFLHHVCNRDDGLVVAEDSIITDPGVVREVLLAKFKWLAFADVDPILEALDHIFSLYEIENLAPGHGQVVVGKRASSQTVQVMLDALASLKEESRI